VETRRIQRLESALRSLSYDTLLKVKESIARDAAQREKERAAGAATNGGSDVSLKEERHHQPPSPFRNGQLLEHHPPPHHFGPRMGLGSPLATAAAAAAAAINSGIDFRSLNYNIKSEAALMGPVAHHLPPSILFPLPTSLSHSVSSSSY